MGRHFFTKHIIKEKDKQSVRLISENKIKVQLEIISTEELKSHRNSAYQYIIP